MDVSSLKPSKLWKQIAAEDRLETARAFWADNEDVAAQAEAVDALARHLKFRARSVIALPIERRARYLSSLPAVSDSLASRLLVSYHLTRQRPMMAAFLDALGIPHEDGLITAEEVAPPDADTCGKAAREMMGRFPPEQVSTYFATLLLQDPDAWAPLRDVLNDDGGRAG